MRPIDFRDIPVGNPRDRINRVLFQILALSGLMAAWTASADPATPANASGGPKIQFESSTHDFGKAMEGEAVTYSYVFTNTGDATLQVSDVHACHCLTFGSFTKQVEPGMTGTIPLSFNTSGLNGAVNRTITVVCNEKNHQSVQLLWKGTVWRALEVNPQTTILNLTSDNEQGSGVVRIVNNLDDPITVSDPQSNNPQFAAELKEIKPGKEFQVTISSVPPLKAGNLHGEITLKTSSTRVPVIKITAYANVRAPIEADPQIVQVPVGPLIEEFKKTINLVNKGTKPIKLTEASINADGADVVLKEIQPGFKYEADLTFKQGFDMPRNQRPSLTIKTDSTLQPQVLVHLFQPISRSAGVRPAPAVFSQGKPAPMPQPAPPPQSATLSQPGAH
jgi:Protein of unknown function (DUF1573)